MLKERIDSIFVSFVSFVYVFRFSTYNTRVRYSFGGRASDTISSDTNPPPPRSFAFASGPFPQSALSLDIMCNSVYTDVMQTVGVADPTLPQQPIPMQVSKGSTADAVVLFIYLFYHVVLFPFSPHQGTYLPLYSIPSRFVVRGMCLSRLSSC